VTTQLGREFDSPQFHLRFNSILELTLDTSLRWERFCLVEVCLIWGGRSLSLAQTVLEHGSAMVGFEQYRPLLETARYSIAAGLYHDLACRPRRVNIES
jgi:hypothetical protein